MKREGWCTSRPRRIAAGDGIYIASGWMAAGSRGSRKEDGTHRVNFAPNAEIYVDTYSNAGTPPRQDVYRADGKKLATLNENKVAELAEYHLSPVEFFTIKAHDGVTLNCSMIKRPISTRRRNIR